MLLVFGDFGDLVHVFGDLVDVFGPLVDFGDLVVFGPLVDLVVLQRGKKDRVGVRSSCMVGSVTSAVDDEHRGPRAARADLPQILERNETHLAAACAGVIPSSVTSTACLATLKGIGREGKKTRLGSDAVAW